MPDSILILEDNAILRKGMVALLRPQGVAILAAATVAEARAHLKTAQPTHAILDLNLPDGTGVDVLKEMRARGWPTSVIIVTGSVDAAIIQTATELKVDEVLRKPPDWDRIVRWAAGPRGKFLIGNAGQT